MGLFGHPQTVRSEKEKDLICLTKKNYKIPFSVENEKKKARLILAPKDRIHQSTDPNGGHRSSAGSRQAAGSVPISNQEGCQGVGVFGPPFPKKN